MLLIFSSPPFLTNVSGSRRPPVNFSFRLLIILLGFPLPITLTFDLYGRRGFRRNCLFPFGDYGTVYCLIQISCEILVFIRLPSVRIVRTEDSFTHCFVSCFLAQQCWRWLEDLLFFHIDFSSLPFVLHFFWHQYSGAALEFVRLLPILVCWVLWKLRYMFIFDNQPASFPAARKKLQELLSLISYWHPYKYFGLVARLFAQLLFFPCAD